MRRLLMVIVAVFASSCARTVNIEHEKAALIAADADWARTAGDVDKMMSFVAPDATFGRAGMPEVRGENAIRQIFGGMVKTPGFKLTWKATRADVSAAGDIGYTAGTYEMTANNAAGVPVIDKGKYLSTWKKINGSWKVTEDFGGGDAPVPPSSPAVLTPAAAVKWMDAPPFLPKGAKLAVLVGDPSQPAPFTVRVQFPAGARVVPHWHPNDEHVTVLSGTVAIGMGKTFDEKALVDLTAGSYEVTPAATPHFALARTAVTFQVHGIGPYVANYVNPADDPSKK
jgi:ketosteroid isomerase-like protein/quercetin dioxygenase-like cupin family protein